MQYCLVKDNTIGRPQALPRNWQNISNFYLLAPEIVPSYGWFPCHTSEKPAYDDRTQKLTEALTLGDAEVFQTWHITDLTPEEQIAFATARLTEIANQITPFLNVSVARKGYESHVSARTIRESSNPKWVKDGTEAWAYYDLVWNAFEALKSGVQAGTTPLPTADEWFSSLPTLWPAQTPPPDNGNLPSNGTI